MKYGIALFLFFQTTPLAPASRLTNRWVIWNVGQGLWITGVFESRCLHLDAGGERRPGRPLSALCEGKENHLFLSHWDWDHIGGVSSLARSLKSLCRHGLPGGTTASVSRRKIVESVPPCREDEPSLREIRWPHSEKSPNQASRVFVWRNRWLFPGDSPQSEEKKWASRIPADTRILVLGHHGSKTSTSNALLDHLPKLRLAISSARQRRYGHPHAKTVERLAQRKIPLLRTEEWGHLIFEL